MNHRLGPLREYGTDVVVRACTDRQERTGKTSLRKAREPLPGDDLQHALNAGDGFGSEAVGQLEQFLWVIGDGHLQPRAKAKRVTSGVESLQHRKPGVAVSGVEAPVEFDVLRVHRPAPPRGVPYSAAQRSRRALEASLSRDVSPTDRTRFPSGSASTTHDWSPCPTSQALTEARQSLQFLRLVRSDRANIDVDAVLSQLLLGHAREYQGEVAMFVRTRCRHQVPVLLLAGLPAKDLPQNLLTRFGSLQSIEISRIMLATPPLSRRTARVATSAVILAPRRCGVRRSGGPEC